MGLPDEELKDLVAADDLLALLNSEQVTNDIPLQFRISLLIVHLACWKQAFAPVEALQEHGFFSHLLAATEAASQQLEWPAGSNCFPLIWKMAITIEQLGRNGYASCLSGALQPLLVFVYKSDNEPQKDWCIRALRACIANSDGSVKEKVDNLLVAEAGDDYNGECLMLELRQKLFGDEWED